MIDSSCIRNIGYFLKLHLGLLPLEVPTVLHDASLGCYAKLHLGVLHKTSCVSVCVCVCGKG